MPTVRKLSTEEVGKLENKGKSTRRLIEEEYDLLIADFASGDYGEVKPDDNEKRITIRNRLKSAATRHNLQLVFIRSRDDTLRFKVVGADEQVEDEGDEPEPIASDTPPITKRRPGRPRNQTI